MFEGVPIVFNVDALTEIAGGTSKGNQTKWYDPRSDLFIKSQFEYQGRTWKDNMVEVIASSIGLQLGIQCVEYKLCEIRQPSTFKAGCFSKSFLQPGEVFKPYSQLYDEYTASHLTVPTHQLSAHDQAELVLDVYEKITGIDASVYLLGTVALDWLVGNEDRHYNNFGIIANLDGSYRLPPIFDSGLGLFEHDTSYCGLPLEVAMHKVRSKLISSKHSKAYAAVAQLTSLEISGFLDISGMEFPNSLAQGYIESVAKSMGVLLV